MAERDERAYFEHVRKWEAAPVLVCRHCGAEGISSTDSYVGTCNGETRLIDGVPEFDPGGYTEINWDSCIQTGYECSSCGHEETHGPGADAEAVAAALARLVCTTDEFNEDEGGPS